MFIEFPDGETFPIPGTIYSNIGLNGAVAANYVVEPGSHEAGGAWRIAFAHRCVRPGAERDRPGRISSDDDRVGRAPADFGKLTFSATRYFEACGGGPELLLNQLWRSKLQQRRRG